MKDYFDPAAAAYKEARELGSSDPEVYRAECEFWEKFGYAEHAFAASRSLRTIDGHRSAPVARRGHDRPKTSLAFFGRLGGVILERQARSKRTHGDGAVTGASADTDEPLPRHHETP